MTYSTQNAYSFGVVLLQTHYKRDRVDCGSRCQSLSVLKAYVLYNLPDNWY